MEEARLGRWNNNASFRHCYFYMVEMEEARLGRWNTIANTFTVVLVKIVEMEEARLGRWNEK